MRWLRGSKPDSVSWLEAECHCRHNQSEMGYVVRSSNGPFQNKTQRVLKFTLFTTTLSPGVDNGNLLRLGMGMHGG